MYWEQLLKAAPNLPDTKEKYLMMLGAPTGVAVVRQMIEGASTKKGFRLIPKWNQQIINTDTGRLERQYPNIPNTDVAQESAKELKDELDKLSSKANKGPPALNEKLLALIENNDFEGLEKFLHSDDKNPGKRKKVVQVNENRLKTMIRQADPSKALPVYYYDTTEYKQGKVPQADIAQVSKWVSLSDGLLTFKKDKIPPYIKNQLENILNSHAAAELDTEEEVSTDKVKIKLKPSKLVKYIGANIYGETFDVDKSEYAVQLAGPESVLEYLNLLVKMGIRHHEFIPGAEPKKLHKLILKKHTNDTLTIYPALRVILREPEFNINDWRIASKGTRTERATEHHKNRLLMSWEGLSPSLRATYKKEFTDMGGEYLPLRDLYKKSTTQRNRELKNNAELSSLHTSFLEKLASKLEMKKHLFSNENYNFLLALEKKIERGDIDTEEELAEYFGIPDDLASDLSLKLEVILTSELFDEKIELKDLFKKPKQTEDIHPDDGMLFNSKSVKEARKAAENSEYADDLLELVTTLQDVFSTLYGVKQKVGASSKGQIVSQLSEMEPNQLNVQEFEVTSQTLEDIIEMLAQLDWILREGKVMSAKNQFIQAINDNKAEIKVSSFLANITKEYSSIRKSFEEALREKLEEFVESPEKIAYYTKKTKKKGNFYGRLEKIGLINKVG